MASNSPKDSSLQSTKQMLDELDSLMERMLSLPVNEMDDSLTPLKESSASPSLAASLTLLGPEAAQVAEPMERKKSPPSKPTSAPAAKKQLERRPKPPLSTTPMALPELKKPPRRKEEVEPEPEPESASEPEYEPRESLPFSIRKLEPLSNEVLPPTVLPNLEPLLSQTQDMPNHAPVIFSGTPILWMNQVYDHSSMHLGDLGRWMRVPGGCGLLGFSGVALLCIAVGWVLKDWLGWNW